MILYLFLAIVGHFTFASGTVCAPIQNRNDCGYVGITEQQCQGKGCCWQPTANEPWCFYPMSAVTGYAVSNVQNNPYGLEATLTLVQGSGEYGVDITPLHLSVVMETEERLHVKIYDPNDARWEVPYVVVAQPQKVTSAEYEFSMTENPFGFAVTRVSTGEVLFNTTLDVQNPLFNGLIFEDQYLELSSWLPSDRNIYGLGEHIRPLRLSPDTYTLWNADHGTPFNENLYGSHPFYLDVRQDSGNAHGVFLLNSNGMDVVLQENAITYKVIGGILDFYFFIGPTPDAVINQYTDLIGKPYFIPYWGLGFHQCRWGYHNISEVEYVVKQYAAHNIPLDTMWTDIDYMDAYMDFTFDPVNFPPAQMAEFVDNLHANHQQYVIITDPGIKNLSGYAPFDLGNEMDVWIKDNKGHPFIGKVWPGLTVFPDFTRTNSFAYWEENINQFQQVAAFDGLWIDMNEISNFCSGECANTSTPGTKKLGFDPNNPPYAINNANNYSPLDANTISMDAVHNITLEYNCHNLFAMLESWATQEALEKVRGKRAFVISRSSFPSSGRHTGHWTGDTTSAWKDLYGTVPDIMNFNILGIPFIGADICGFNGDTTEELCARWIELGAFYPFSRDHNSIGSTPQELYVWPLVANISRFILGVRYSLLPYYYTQFFQVNSGLAGTVLRPLFFEFPNDPLTYGIDRQFLVGPGLLISPVLEEGATTVTAYFPNTNWYDFFTMEPVPYSGENVTLSSPIDTIQVHIRGGLIIPTQQPAYTTWETRQNPFSLIVAIETATSQASGFLYLDDGDSLNTVEQGLFTLLYFNATYTSSNSGAFNSILAVNGYSEIASQILDTINFLGVTSEPSTLTVNGKPTSFVYNSEAQILTVSNLQFSFANQMTLKWA